MPYFRSAVVCDSPPRLAFMTTSPVDVRLDSIPHGFGHVGDNRIVVAGSTVNIIRRIDLHPFDMQIRLPQGAWMPWRRTGEGEMSFVAVITAQTIGTLDQLAARLRKLVAEGLQDDELHPEVVLFKDVYVQLIKASAEAHKQGCRLGLLDPTNVIYAVADGKTQVYLPDAGFIWTGGVYVPKHLTLDRWHGDPSQGDKMVQLWHPHPSIIDAETKGSPREEAIALARMLAWVLSGSVPTTPMKAMPTDTHSAVYRCWQILNPLVVSDSKVTDATTLLSVMSRAPLWKAFIKESKFTEATATRARKRLPIGVLSSLAMLLVFFGIVVAYRQDVNAVIFGPEPLRATSVCESCNKPGEFYNELVKLDVNDGVYTQLSDVFKNGNVDKNVIKLWVLGTTLSDSQRSEFDDVESRHFAFVADLLARQSQSLMRLRALQKSETDSTSQISQSQCTEKLAGELKRWIEHTDAMINWSEYFARGLDPDVIQKVVNVAVEFKSSFTDYLPEEINEWPKHLSEHVRQTEADRAAAAR